MKIIRSKGYACEKLLTIISHLGPTHLQRVSASLFGRLDHPIYPSLLLSGKIFTFGEKIFFAVTHKNFAPPAPVPLMTTIFFQHYCWFPHTNVS